MVILSFFKTSDEYLKINNIITMDYNKITNFIKELEKENKVGNNGNFTFALFQAMASLNNLKKFY